MKKRSIQASVLATIVLMTLSAVDAQARDDKMPLVEKPISGSSKGADSGSVCLVTSKSPFACVPTDERLKKIYDDFLQFRSDLALRHLAPLITARTKAGLKRPQDRVVMARLMELVSYSYMVDDNYSAALNSAIIAQKICPEDLHVKCLLANLFRALPDTHAEDRLISELKKIPEKDGFPYLYFTLARNSWRDGRFNQTIDYLNKAEAIDVERRQSNIEGFRGRVLVRTGLNEEAKNRFRKSAELTENKYLREIILANVAQIEFNDAVQEAHLLEASKIYPADPIWRLKLADVYFQRGNDTKAIPLLQEAFRCKRFSIGAYVRLARYYLRKGKSEKALAVVQYLERSTRITPDTLILRGDIEADRKQFSKAEKYYKQALEISPQNLEPYEMLSQFYRRIAKRPQDAVRVSIDYVKHFPEYWQAHYCSAQALLSAKKLAPAEREAAKALELLSAYPKADLNLYALHRAGVAHAIVGTKYFVEDKDLERAVEEAKAFNQMKFNPDLPPYLRIVSLRPERIQFKDDLGLKDPMVHVALADMLLENNYFEQCIAEYKKAQELAPGDQTVRSYLIHALSQKGDWAGAASENLAFSQNLVNQIPGAIDDLRGGKKKKQEASGAETKTDAEGDSKAGTSKKEVPATQSVQDSTKTETHVDTAKQQGKMKPVVQSSAEKRKGSGTTGGAQSGSR